MAIDDRLIVQSPDLTLPPASRIPEVPYLVSRHAPLDIDIALISATVIAVAVCFALGWLIPTLGKRGVLVPPLDRSSRAVAARQEGGIGFVAVLLPALAAGMIWAEVPLLNVAAIVGGGVVLVAISIIDEASGLRRSARLAIQLAVVGAVLVPLIVQIFQWNRRDALLLILAWAAWACFISLYRHMDRTPGISAVQTVIIGLGLSVIIYDTGFSGRLFFPAVLMTGAVLGLLIWSRQPARLHLGDAGSVTLGFVIGWMLLRLIESGLWAAAIILPSYYFADAAVSFLRRLNLGDSFGQGQSESFFGRAIRANRSAGELLLVLAVTGALLIGLAWWSVDGNEWPALVITSILLILLMAWMFPRRNEASDGDA